MFRRKVDKKELYEALVRVGRFYAQFLNMNGVYYTVNDDNFEGIAFASNDVKSVFFEDCPSKIIVENAMENVTKDIIYSYSNNNYGIGYEVQFAFKHGSYEVSDVITYGYDCMENLYSDCYHAIMAFFQRLEEELTAPKKELARLEKENDELREENEKLKESVAMLKVK